MGRALSQDWTSASVRAGSLSLVKLRKLEVRLARTSILICKRLRKGLLKAAMIARLDHKDDPPNGNVSELPERADCTCEMGADMTE